MVAAFIIYSITLIFSVLLFGAAHTYAYTCMTLAVLIGSLLALKKCIQKNLKSGVYELKLPATSLHFAFILLLVFFFLQTFPLPDFIIRIVSPESWVVAQKSLPASTSATSAGPTRAWSALSPYYYPVRMSIIRLTVYGLFFFGLIQVLNSRKRIELMIFLILITGCFEALYGLMETYSGSEHIWWFKKVAYRGDVCGTYINRNHFAGLMEMGLLLAAALAAGLAVRKSKQKVRSDNKSGLRAKFLRYLSGEQRFNKRILVLFSGIVMGIGLIFSASRGGMIAAAGALFLMGLLLTLKKKHRRKGIIFLVLFMLTSIYAIQIGVEYPLKRFKYFDDSFETRTRYAQKTLDMFSDYSVAGIGMGNFQYAYPKYQAVEDTKIFIQHAHNDWAQFLAEAGIAGFLLLLAGISYYVYRTMRLWLKRNDPFAVCLGAGSLAAVTSMAIHSYSDFNLHVPANCLMLAAIMAIGSAALHLERRRHREVMLYSYHSLPLQYKGIMVLIPMLGLIIWSGCWTMRHFMAEAYCNTVHNSTLNREQNPALREITKAIEWDRWNGEYYFKMARELAKIRDSEVLNPDWNMEERRKRQLEIITALEQAVRLNPFNAKYHLTLGWEYTYLWKDRDGYSKWLPAADLSVERAAYWAGVKTPYLHVKIGDYWTMRSKTVYPTNPMHKIFWASACRHYRKARSLEKSEALTDKIVKYVWSFYPDQEKIRDLGIRDRGLGIGG